MISETHNIQNVNQQNKIRKQSITLTAPSLRFYLNIYQLPHVTKPYNNELIISHYIIELYITSIGPLRAILRSIMSIRLRGWVHVADRAATLFTKPRPSPRQDHGRNKDILHQLPFHQYYNTTTHTQELITN